VRFGGRFSGKNCWRGGEGENCAFVGVFEGCFGGMPVLGVVFGGEDVVECVADVVIKPRVSWL